MARNPPTPPQNAELKPKYAERALRLSLAWPPSPPLPSALLRLIPCSLAQLRPHRPPRSFKASGTFLSQVLLLTLPSARTILPRVSCSAHWALSLVTLLKLHPHSLPASTSGRSPIAYPLYVLQVFPYCLSTPTRVSAPGRQELLPISFAVVSSALGAVPGTQLARDKYPLHGRTASGRPRQTQEKGQFTSHSVEER